MAVDVYCVVANRRKHRRESCVKKKKRWANMRDLQRRTADSKLQIQNFRRTSLFVTPATSRHREPFPPLINISCDL